MNKKEIVNVHKRPDGIFEIETFEKPLRTQIAELEEENKQLKEQLAEKEEEIKKLKKIAEIKAYQKEISHETIIDNVAFTREQICVINSINAIREYNQNQKAKESIDEKRD